MNKNTDINHGLDFERARDRASNVAGQRFREYLEIKNGDAPEKAVHQARVSYLEAAALERTLKPTDHEAISEILGEAHV